MNKIEEIKREVMSLSPKDVWKLAEWLDEFKNELWDQQIEADAKAGRLDVLADKSLNDQKAGKAGTRTFRGKTR